MASFNGKWKRISVENSDAIIKALVGDDAGKTAELKAYYELADVVDEVTVTAEGTNRVTFINGEKKTELDSKFGAEVERNTFLGKSKIFGTRVSDSRIDVKETGLDHPSSDYIFEVKGGKLHVLQTVGDVKCSRVYEKC